MPRATTLNDHHSLQTKERRVLLLCREHLVFLRWHGPGERANGVRWALHLEHISSITTVAHTLVILCTKKVQLGPVQLEVPQRRCLASEQDAVADLLLHKVNRVLDTYFKNKYMHDKVVGRSSTGRQVRCTRS
jgi:hypothetical protein